MFRGYTLLEISNNLTEQTERLCFLLLSMLNNFYGYFYEIRAVREDASGQILLHMNFTNCCIPTRLRTRNYFLY